MNTNLESIDQYIQSFPEEVREKLNLIRSTIVKAAPAATEAIKYAMPTFMLDGNLIHFAAYKKHIGIYPAPAAIEAFDHEIAKYRTSKGAIQIPLDEKIPVKLITAIVKFNIKRNQETAAFKKARKK